MAAAASSSGGGASGGGGADGDVAEKRAGALFTPAQEKAVRALTWCSVLRYLGIMIRMQTESEIWLRAYAGDFAAQATAQGAPRPRGS